MPLEQRFRVLGMLEAVMAVTKVARNIGVCHSTILRLQTKFNATGSLKTAHVLIGLGKLLPTKTAILHLSHIVIALHHLRE